MSKYKAVRTNGYASKREANRAAELALLERDDIVGPVSKQVSFTLLPADPAIGYPRALRYVADFQYVDLGTGATIVEDVKGFKTPVYILKKRLMRQLLGIEVIEV